VMRGPRWILHPVVFVVFRLEYIVVIWVLYCNCCEPEQSCRYHNILCMTPEACRCRFTILFPDDERQEKSMREAICCWPWRFCHYHYITLQLRKLDSALSLPRQFNCDRSLHTPRARTKQRRSRNHVRGQLSFCFCFWGGVKLPQVVSGHIMAQITVLLLVRCNRKPVF